MTGGDGTETRADIFRRGPAGFWRRFAAFAIDSWLLVVASEVFDAAWGALSDAHAVGNAAGAAFTVVSNLVILVAYFVICWGWRGQTVGYALLQMRLSRPDGAPVGHGRAFLRLVLVVLSLVLCFVPAIISALTIALGGRKRALHDMLLGTEVAHRQAATSRSARQGERV